MSRDKNKRKHRKKYNTKTKVRKHNCSRMLSDLNPVILEKHVEVGRRIFTAVEAFLGFLCMAIPYVIVAPGFLKESEGTNHLPFLIAGALVMLLFGAFFVYEVVAYFAVRIYVEEGVFQCKNRFHEMEFSILDIQEIRYSHYRSHGWLDLYIELDGRSKCLTFDPNSWDVSEIVRFLLEADEAEKHNGRLFTADERTILKRFRK